MPFSVFFSPPLAGIPFVSHVTASAFCMPTLQMLPGSPNLSLSLGPFTGGRLWLEDLHCMHLGAPTFHSWLHGVAIDTHCRPLSFDGRIRHMTLPYQGERWALTAFTLPGVCCSDLEFLGFPLPCSAVAPSLPLPHSGSSPSSVGATPLGPLAPVVPKNFTSCRPCCSLLCLCTGLQARVICPAARSQAVGKTLYIRLLCPTLAANSAARASPT